MGIKVYHILDHFIPHYSGYTFRTKAILQYQKSFGVEPTLLISPKHSEGLPPYETIDSLPCFRSASLDGKYKIPLLCEYALMEHFRKDILNIAQANRPDIIHAHSPLLDGFPALKVARKLRIPVIYEVRALWEDAAVDIGHTKDGSLRYKLTRHLETNLLKKVDCITTICNGLKQEFIKRGINPDKVHIVPNGVDTTRFYPIPPNQDLINQYGLSGKKVIGFIGSFYKYEGLALLVKTMPEIIAAYPSVVLMLIGTGEVERETKQLVVELSLEKNILFTGQVPNDQIQQYYSIMDLLVYPRDKIRLTDLVTPLKPLEAMAMGKAVLGSDVGGIYEITQGGAMGVLFKSGDADDLTQKCVQTIKDDQRRQELGTAGIAYVKAERDWEAIVKNEIKLYYALLERKNAQNN